MTRIKRKQKESPMTIHDTIKPILSLDVRYALLCATVGICIGIIIN